MSLHLTKTKTKAKTKAELTLGVHWNGGLFRIGGCPDKGQPVTQVPARSPKQPTTKTVFFFIRPTRPRYQSLFCVPSQNLKSALYIKHTIVIYMITSKLEVALLYVVHILTKLSLCSSLVWEQWSEIYPSIQSVLLHIMKIGLMEK